MALAANENYMNGFVRNTQGAIVITLSQTGAKFMNGFLRDPDGRLVVMDD